MWYDRRVGRHTLIATFWLIFTAAAAASAAGADKPDPIGEARALYNQRQYEAAIVAAETARLQPERANAADLIAARAHLERYRASAATEDLASARLRLARLDPMRFPTRERVEFIVGLGETLYFEGSFGPAAEVFGSALEGAEVLGPDARERVLDWWASALDSQARSRTDAERHAAYERIRDRMRGELSTRPTSGAAAYWLAAAARGRGEWLAAWDAAEAGWARAPLTADRGAKLRADLDQLVTMAVVPERARALRQSAESLRAEWEQFKDRWKGE